jgi:hypothetical protein
MGKEKEEEKDLKELEFCEKKEKFLKGGGNKRF